MAGLLATVTTVTATAAFAVMLLGGITLLLTGVVGRPRTDWLYLKIAGWWPDRSVDRSFDVLTQCYGFVRWAIKARRLAIRGRARIILSAFFILAVTALLLVSLLSIFVFQAVQTGTTSPPRFVIVAVLVVMGAYVAALMMTAAWDEVFHSDESLVMSSLFILRYSDGHGSGAGLQRVSGVLGQLRLVSKRLGQFERQVLRSSTFGPESVFVHHIGNLRYLIHGASEAVVANDPLLPDRLAEVAYRCSEVAATGRIAPVVDPESTVLAPPRPSRLPVFLTVTVLIVGVAVYALTGSETSSTVSLSVAFLVTLVGAVRGVREVLELKESS